jgi:hypothetical protein
MRWLFLVIVSLLFTACEEVHKAAAGSVTTQNATAGGGNIPDNAAGFLSEPPQFTYPEDSNIYLEREVEVPSNSAAGGFHVFHEVLRADGQGFFNLKIIETMMASDTVFGAPSVDVEITYQDQQRYMVKYRDIHLGRGLSQNFNWTEDPVLQQIAGVDCVHYTVESVHGLGDAEFWTDANNEMLLAYTLFDNAGEVTLKLTTTVIDTSPIHAGVSWSSSLVNEQGFDPENNSILLDFEVSEPAYLPPGFYKKSVRVLNSLGMFPGMGNLHVALFSDGIHQLFIAQHSEASVVNNGGVSQPPNSVTLARFSETGGIRMVEGNPPLKKIYVVGPMARDEIHTVFSSLF